MRRFLRVSFLTITIATVAGVGLRASGVWQRFKDQQFKNGEARSTGWVARIFAWAAPWAGAWIYGVFARVLDLQPTDEVLDVACGSGTFLRKHTPHVQRIADLDHSQDLIDIALRDHRERVAAGTAEFVVGDATDLPWGDNQFSAVTSSCVSCFEAKAQPALEEMYRVLRPGGRAAVGDDRRQMMEAMGFTHVSGGFRGMVTTGFKE